MSAIADKVKKIVVQNLGCSEDQVTDDAKFIEHLGADSLDQVELVMQLEEEFGVTIPDNAAEKIVTVGDAIKYIEDSLGGQGAAEAPKAEAPKAEEKKSADKAE